MMELAVVNAANAVEIFMGGGLAGMLDKIEQQVRSITLDVSTPGGRDQIRSLAYKVARTKTALDAEAKKLTEGWRESTKKVNEERKQSQERLDALADEVRTPLTEFENRDKVRIAGHESAIAELILFSSIQSQATADELEAKALEFSNLHADRQWEEFSHRANKQRVEIADYLNERLSTRRKFDADQTELKAHRKEAAARMIREHEEKLKSEAADKARAEAERRAKEAADAEAHRVIEAAKKEEARVHAEAERVRAEHERRQHEAEVARKKEEDARLLAEKRASEAEAARVAADRKAEADKRAAEDLRIRELRNAEVEKAAAAAKAREDLKAAQEQAKRDAEAAVENERARIANETASAAEVLREREADELHRAQIRHEIAEDLKRHWHGGPPHGDGLYSIIEAIMDGKVRHVRVDY